MELIRDASMMSHAAQIGDTFETARQALPGRTEDGLESAEDELVDLPDEVQKAQEAFKQLLQGATGASVDLRIVQYFRYVNDEQVEGWSSELASDAEAVQISQTIAINSAYGAYLDIRQWIAQVEPAP
ncbi:MAG TPA: hypothetical protein VKY74_09955 [Chloroflexia bacterium]|nr:hypothetical protein [Chloroflexia bacterium]